MGNREGERYQRMLERWVVADTSKLPYSGPGTVPGSLGLIAYDMGVALVHSAIKAHREGLLTDDRLPTAAEWFRLFGELDFFGASGHVAFNEKGDRYMPISLYNWRPEKVKWVPFAEVTREGEVVLNVDTEILWNDNSTFPPDLRRAPGYNYWSCHEKKMKFDETGHDATLHTRIPRMLMISTRTTCVIISLTVGTCQMRVTIALQIIPSCSSCSVQSQDS